MKKYWISIEIVLAVLITGLLAAGIIAVLCGAVHHILTVVVCSALLYISLTDIRQIKESN